LGREAEGHFGLNDDVDFVDEVGEAEQVMKDRRSNVVRKIAVDAHAASGSDRGDICFENIAGNDGEVGKFLRQAAEARDERWIEFDGVNGSAGGEEVLGHFTMARTNFDPAMLIVPMNRDSHRTLVPTRPGLADDARRRERRDGVGRNANGACDLFAPLDAFQEVLAEALACHGRNSVARGARCAPRGKEVRR